MALVLIMLGGSGLTIYNEHSILFKPYITHSDSESCANFFFVFCLFFFSFPYSLRHILTKFEDFSQQVVPDLLCSLKGHPFSLFQA